MVGKICGTGSYAPALVWSNNKLAEMVDTSDEWIRERTGIARRHVISGIEDAAYMAAQAAQEALKSAGMRSKEIDLMLVATMSSEGIMPCTACEVQGKIGADRATCFDMNAACTGFLYALNTAQAYLGQGIYRTAIVIGVESLSNQLNWKDRSTCILFGDGAGAVVLKAQDSGRYAQVTHSDGTRGEVLTCSSRNQIRFEENPKDQSTYMQMDGGEVFKFAVSKVPEVIRELLRQEKLSADDIDYYILHQANERIVRLAAKRLKLGMDKFPMNMEEYGNTSSASIPILLDELNKKEIFHNGDQIVISGFGGGLTYGASLMEW